MNVGQIKFSNNIQINNKNQKLPLQKPSFKANERALKAGMTGLTAMAASAVAAMNMNSNKINESDINFGVTLCGAGNVKGNTCDVPDLRYMIPDRGFSLPIFRKFLNKGKVYSAIIFRLHPDSDGLRGGDNMTMLLNTEIDTNTASKLVGKMDSAGIITHKKYPAGNTVYFVNSPYPEDFMSNPKIKTIIANFLNETNGNVENIQATNQKTRNGYNLSLKDINIVELDRKQDKDNQREVKDYIREFLKNNKKFTVVHDKINDKNQEKDITALLLPVKHDWDCVTITVDRNIPEEKCAGLMNYLGKNGITNTEDSRFKTTIVEYFNSL